MKPLVPLLALAVVLAAAETRIKAQYIGGTAAGISAKSSARLDLTRPDALFFFSGPVELRIDYRRINTIEYGQSVSRRYAEAVLISPLLLLSKSRKHFVTIGYVDRDGNQQALCSVWRRAISGWYCHRSKPAPAAASNTRTTKPARERVKRCCRSYFWFLPPATPS